MSKSNKINLILTHVLSALVGIFLTLIFAECMLPWISVHIRNRNHLLDIEVDDYASQITDGRYNILALKVKNIHSAFTIEDINLNVDLSDRIEKVIVGADEGVFSYQISKGQDAFAFNTQRDGIQEVPSNHRNIKIGKIFPKSFFVLSIFLTSKPEGNAFFPHGLTEPGSVKYTVDYSYKFWGATVRRKIKNSLITTQSSRR